jgi:hypothetical protein
MFSLCWQQHGGSGLAMSWAEAMRLDVPTRDWLLERVGRQREAEAAALSRAARRR